MAGPTSAAGRNVEAALVDKGVTNSSERSSSSGGSSGGGGSGGGGTRPEFPFSPAVAQQLMHALVRSGRLDQYDSESSEAPAEGASHRSLPLLLEQVRRALGGDGLADAPPGSAPARPLHVIVSGGALSAGGGAGREAAPGWLAALWSFLGFCLSLALLTAIWNAGARAVGRYGGGLGGLGAAGGGAAVPSVSGTPQAGLFGAKEYSKENLPERSVKKFGDVKGCDEAVEELQEIVAYLKSPDKFTRLGGRLPKGVLLTGPPGKAAGRRLAPPPHPSHPPPRRTLPLLPLLPLPPTPAPCRSRARGRLT